MFERLGAFVYTRRWLVVGASALLLLVSAVLLVRGGRLGPPTIAGLEADAAVALADEVTGRREETTVAVLFRSADLAPTDARFREAMREALAPQEADPRVARVTSPENAETLMIERLRDADAKAALALVTLRGTTDEAIAAYPGVRAALREGPLSITCTGHVPFLHDLEEVLAHDLVRAELLSLPLALVVLLLVFRTAVAAALPVVVGGLSVLVSVAFVTALSRVTPIASYTINVCSLIGFGVAIDYSLFFVSRYREELDAGRDVREALVRSMGTAGRAVAFSGLAVGTGLAGLFFFRSSYLSVMGLGGSIVVGLAVVFASTLLPALLAVLGPRIHAGRIPGVGASRERSVFWRRTARAVMKRPLLFLAPTSLALLALAAPSLRMRVAAADASVLPASTEARRGAEALDAAFPTLGSARLTVVVRFPDGPVLTSDRVGALYDFAERALRIPDVAAVESVVSRPRDRSSDDDDGSEANVDDDPAEIRAERIETLVSPSPMAAPIVEEAARLMIRDPLTVLYVVLTPEAAKDVARAEAVVRALRAERRVADGDVLVGGKAARDVDATEFLVSRAPRAVAFVVTVTFVVLLLLLRSVVLPLKAVLMNALSIGATFGALVWIFQDGHLTEGRPLEPTLPVLLFCVSFGLSMDYEVLILARMKEAWEESGDSAAAVEEGLGSTAGLVTSAAAIMVSVFGAFALTRVVLLQATGTGLALAVALDATLVRALLVPAMMRLFGKANWWAPRWVHRLGDRARR